MNCGKVRGKASCWYDAFGSDRLAELERLSLVVRERFPNSVFFASVLVFKKERPWNRWLHSDTPTEMQRILNEHGIELVVLPITLREPEAPTGRFARPAI